MLWSILCATFGEKKIDRAISGHGAYDFTNRGTRSDHFLPEMADYCTLEGDIDHDKPSGTDNLGRAIDTLKKKLSLGAREFPVT